MENISRHNTASGHKGSAPKRGGHRAVPGTGAETERGVKTERGAVPGGGGNIYIYKKVPAATRPGQGFGNLHS